MDDFVAPAPTDHTSIPNFVRPVAFLSEGKVNDTRIQIRDTPPDLRLAMWTPERGWHVGYLPNYHTATLTRGLTIWMSDTPMELETNAVAMRAAHGDVLECGLGLGYFSYNVARSPAVKKLDILEYNRDLETLVYEKVKNEKTSIQFVNDARDWLQANADLPRKQRKLYDLIHIDIWAGPNEPHEHFSEMHRLARPSLKKGGVTICWLEGTRPYPHWAYRL